MTSFLELLKQYPLLIILIFSNAVAFLFYWGIGTLLSFIYYKSEPPHPKRCQPERMPSPEIVKKDFILGSSNVLLLSCLSGAFVYFVVLSGYSQVYFDLSEHGLLFSIITGIAYLLALDFSLYFAHRLFHIPYLYRRFHKIHHRNVTPIAVNSVAIHPFEICFYHSLTLFPLLVIPMHYGAAVACLLYTNYVSLIDHSGIKYNPWLFWQSPSQFHDDHHKYFHVNYGQTLWLWDWLFGTWRRKGKVYGPKNFEKKGDYKLFARDRKDYVNYSEGESFFIKYRSAIIICFCLPVSFLFNLFHAQLLRIQRWMNRDPHHESVALVEADLRKLQADPPKKICTDRKNWKSLSTRLFDKKPYAKVRIGHLTNILEIDREKLSVRVEPLVTVGQITDYLIPMGYCLAVCLEIREATLGGLAMGVGMTTHSHKAGLFQETILAYEVILPGGEYLRVTEKENGDLFRALPWSHGTLGIIVGLELRIIPAKQMVYLQYTPVFSQQEYCQKIRELAVKPDAADFLEATIFSKDQAVIMEGWFHDGKGSDLPPINHINKFHKPWFFKHTETYLKRGRGAELIPLKDYIFRHNRSIFWVLQDMIPSGNSPLARYTLGWMYPPSIAFLKFTLPSEARKFAARRQVFQDIILPLTALSRAIDLSDQLFTIYPLLVYPCRIYDHGDQAGQLRAPRKQDLVPGANFGMYCDLGVYGVPKSIKENQIYDIVDAMRKFEEFIRIEGGYPFLYADTFMTEREFAEIFDLRLYEQVRNKYNLDLSFPHLFEKTRMEVQL